MPHGEAVVVPPLVDVAQTLVGEKVDFGVLVTHRNVVAESLKFLAAHLCTFDVLHGRRTQPLVAVAIGFQFVPPIHRCCDFCVGDDATEDFGLAIAVLLEAGCKVKVVLVDSYVGDSADAVSVDCQLEIAFRATFSTFGEAQSLKSGAEARHFESFNLDTFSFNYFHLSVFFVGFNLSYRFILLHFADGTQPQVMWNEPNHPV